MVADGPGVACFGGLHVDVTAIALEPVQPATSNPVRTSARIGGVASNVARVLARLGNRVVVCSVVGDDLEGEAVLAGLSAERIDTSGVVRVAGTATARYTAVIEPDGSLFVGLADSAIYDSLGPDWVAGVVAAAERCGIWMVDTNLPVAVIEAVVAEAGERLVVADPVSVSKAGRLTSVVGSLSAVFPDGGELAELAGAGARHEMVTALHARGPTVVASFGAEGVVFGGHEGTEERPAMPVERVVDETGAGDALLAGFLHGVIHGEADPVAWGLAAAALAVSGQGSIPSGLTLEGVEELVASTR